MHQTHSFYYQIDIFELLLLAGLVLVPVGILAAIVYVVVSLYRNRRRK